MPVAVNSSLKNGKYRNLQLIAEGGMSQIYKAVTDVCDPMVGIRDEDVVLKKLDITKIALSPKEAEEMFKIEKELLQKLDKNNSIFPHYREDFEENGEKYLVMQYIEGENLYDLVRQKGKLDQEEVKKIGLELLRAIRQIHQLNYLYRDMKPQNIIKTPYGGIRLIDLGIVHPTSGKNQTHLIQQEFGTLEFAAPEQFHGKADERSDLYSIGRTMQFLLIGKDYKPFEIDSLLKKIISPRLAGFLKKVMSLDQRNRFQTAEAMEKALKQIKIIKLKPRKQAAISRINKIRQFGGKITGYLKQIKIGDWNDAKKILLNSWFLSALSVTLFFVWLFAKDYFYLSLYHTVVIWIAIIFFFTILMAKCSAENYHDNPVYFVSAILSGSLFVIGIIMLLTCNFNFNFDNNKEIIIFYRAPIEIGQETKIEWRTALGDNYRICIIAPDGKKKELKSTRQENIRNGFFSVVLTKPTTLKFIIQREDGQDEYPRSLLFPLIPAGLKKIEILDNEPLKF